MPSKAVLEKASEIAVLKEEKAATHRLLAKARSRVDELTAERDTLITVLQMIDQYALAGLSGGTVIHDTDEEGITSIGLDPAWVERVKERDKIARELDLNNVLERRLEDKHFGQPHWAMTQGTDEPKDTQ